MISSRSGTGTSEELSVPAIDCTLLWTLSFFVKNHFRHFSPSHFLVDRSNLHEKLQPVRGYLFAVACVVL